MATTQTSGTSGPRLLIAAADPTAAVELAHSLAEPRITVLVASNGVEAISQARAFAPQAAILDAALPGMDGFAVFNVMRVDPVLRYVKVILIGAGLPPGALSLAKDVGAYAALQKPCAPDKLRAKVLAALDLDGEGGGGRRRSRSGDLVAAGALSQMMTRPPPPIVAPGEAPSPPGADTADFPSPAAAAAKPGPRRERLVLLIAPRGTPFWPQLERVFRGARVVLAPPESPEAASLALDPALAAVFLADLPATDLGPLMVHFEAARVRAPIVEITDGAPRHPRALALRRAFADEDVRAIFQQASEASARK